MKQRVPEKRQRLWFFQRFSAPLFRVFCVQYWLPAAIGLVGCSGSSRGPALAPARGFAMNAGQIANRLTFGPRPGDSAAIANVGPQKWLETQLHPETIDDHRLDAILAPLETQHKSAYELIADHPLPQELLPRLNTRTIDGKQVLPTAKDSASYRQSQQVANALTQQMLTGRVLRAAFSERQLLEVMVDFWENHFSVHIAKSPSRYSLVDYDRLTIRPHALGKFRDLLGAVATSPQMLFYLDNWQSYVDSLHPTIVESRIQQRRAAMSSPPLNDSAFLTVAARRRSGLNENYARELLELHTMGVNGGYTQQDVINVARCLTGWSIDNPQLGGSFVFRSDLHDAGEKTILGVKFPAGRGIEDGQQLLDLLAKHPSTARYIAQKLVIRLVSDTAPPQLVARAADMFLKTDGDIREVVRTIVMSPEFFAASAYHAKVKTPFEFVVSTVRYLGAQPDTTNRLVGALTRLGQPVWGRVTPDGWPDRGDAWVNSGTISNRIAFATQAASGTLPGFKTTPGAALIIGSPEFQRR